MSFHFELGDCCCDPEEGELAGDIYGPFRYGLEGFYADLVTPERGYHYRSPVNNWPPGADRDADNSSTLSGWEVDSSDIVDTPGVNYANGQTIISIAPPVSGQDVFFAVRWTSSALFPAKRGAIAMCDARGRNEVWQKVLPDHTVTGPDGVQQEIRQDVIVSPPGLLFGLRSDHILMTRNAIWDLGAFTEPGLTQLCGHTSDLAITHQSCVVGAVGRQHFACNATTLAVFSGGGSVTIGDDVYRGTSIIELDSNSEDVSHDFEDQTQRLEEMFRIVTGSLETPASVTVDARITSVCHRAWPYVFGCKPPVTYYFDDATADSLDVATFHERLTLVFGEASRTFPGYVNSATEQIITELDHTTTRVLRRTETVPGGQGTAWAPGSSFNRHRPFVGGKVIAGDAYDADTWACAYCVTTSEETPGGTAPTNISTTVRVVYRYNGGDIKTAEEFTVPSNSAASYALTDLSLLMAPEGEGEGGPPTRFVYTRGTPVYNPQAGLPLRSGQAHCFDMEAEEEAWSVSGAAYNTAAAVYIIGVSTEAVHLGNIVLNPVASGQPAYCYKVALDGSRWEPYDGVTAEDGFNHPDAHQWRWHENPAFRGESPTTGDVDTVKHPLIVGA